MTELAPLSGGVVEVLTFKEGLLSKVAHDLLLRVERFDVETDGQRVVARFYPASIVVVDAMRDGHLDAGTLSDRDRAEIRENIQKKVLHADKHPEATFRGEGRRRETGYHVEGTLRLLGAEHAVAFEARERDGRLTGEVELTPSQWGITPFKALLGAIKLRDRVVLRFELPSL
ncbi:MAG: YceI family protein [Myxococcales bacterium]|nr:YceI family protein [Myxococcales bacterium]MCB9579477.1 YceI family protein [Polyangiaceae bacterium]